MYVLSWDLKLCSESFAWSFLSKIINYFKALILNSKQRSGHVCKCKYKIYVENCKLTSSFFLSFILGWLWARRLDQLESDADIKQMYTCRGFSLDRIQLQLVKHHPLWHVIAADRQHVSFKWTARPVDLHIIGRCNVGAVDVIARAAASQRCTVRTGLVWEPNSMVRTVKGSWQVKQCHRNPAWAEFIFS